MTRPRAGAPDITREMINRGVQEYQKWISTGSGTGSLGFRHLLGNGNRTALTFQVRSVITRSNSIISGDVARKCAALSNSNNTRSIDSAS